MDARARNSEPLPQAGGMHRRARPHHAHVPLAAHARGARVLRDWMEAAGMTRRRWMPRAICAASTRRRGTPGVCIIGSHLDTVPRRGRVRRRAGRGDGHRAGGSAGRPPLPFAIEVVGFSEEEGVRFGVPFIGSRALVGDLTTLAAGCDRQSRGAIRAFGLDPARIAEARRCRRRRSATWSSTSSRARCSKASDLPLGVVDAIVGQSRLQVTFQGKANHAGTTPMHVAPRCAGGRRRMDRRRGTRGAPTPGLVATVGAIAGRAGRGQRDRRHACAPAWTCAMRDDGVRQRGASACCYGAREIAARRNLAVRWEQRLRSGRGDDGRQL